MASSIAFADSNFDCALRINEQKSVTVTLKSPFKIVEVCNRGKFSFGYNEEADKYYKFSNMETFGAHRLLITPKPGIHHEHEINIIFIDTSLNRAELILKQEVEPKGSKDYKGY
jgi:hypothetical protein